MGPAVSALIPAAGNSARMGIDKALLHTSLGSPFSRHLAEIFSAFGCNPVILVVNERFPATLREQTNFEFVMNRHIEKGRTYSIQLGLKLVPANYPCFIQNTDNPFLDPALLESLAGSLSPEVYAVPVFNGRGGHPILLGESVVDALRGQENGFDFRKELSKFRRTEVPWNDNRILLNINSPGDYDEFISSDRGFDKKM